MVIVFYLLRREKMLGKTRRDSVLGLAPMKLENNRTRLTSLFFPSPALNRHQESLRHNKHQRCYQITLHITTIYHESHLTCK